LTTNGTVLAWGDDSFGQSSPPSGLTNVVSVTAGPRYSVAIQSGGTIIGWGSYYDDLTAPPGLSNVISAAAGDSHIVALRSDGAVVAWGNDLDGEADVPAGMRNVIAVGAGGDDQHGSVSFALVAEPELAISQSSTNTLVVSWPSWSTGAVLEQSSNLQTGTWSEVTNSPGLGDGRYSVAWTDASRAIFFRLRQ
jgi:hypothetical protein